MLKFSLSLHMPDLLGRHPADPDATGLLRRGSPLGGELAVRGLQRLRGGRGDAAYFVLPIRIPSRLTMQKSGYYAYEEDERGGKV